MTNADSWQVAGCPTDSRDRHRASCVVLSSWGDGLANFDAAAATRSAVPVPDVARIACGTVGSAASATGGGRDYSDSAAAIDACRIDPFHRRLHVHRRQDYAWPASGCDRRRGSSVTHPYAATSGDDRRHLVHHHVRRL